MLTIYHTRAFNKHIKSVFNYETVWQIHRAKDVFTQHGFIELLRRSTEYTERYIKTKARGSSILPYQSAPYYKQRVDSESRWSFIRPHVTNLDQGIDIGCSHGYFTNKLAEEGILSLGLESDSHKLSYGLNEWGWKSNIGFANWEINPDNIHKLPPSDVTLLLTVYHHFVAAFGVQNSIEILQTVGANTDKLICEMPGNRLAGLSFDYICTNTKDGEIYNVTDWQEDTDLKPQNSGRIYPRLGRYLPKGNYDVIAKADGYKQSSSLNITVTRSNRLEGDQPRVRLNEDSIELTRISSRRQDIDDVVKWYDDLLYHVFNDNIKIEDKKLTEHKGNRRQDILYVIDTTEISSS